MSNTEIVYSQRRKIVGLKEYTRQVHVSGAGKDATFRTVSLGWGVILEPGHDVFFVGAEKPAFLPGQFVTFSIKGVIQNASFNPTGPDLDNKDASPGGQRNG